MDLKQIEVFKGFNDDELKKFMEVISEKRLKKDEILFTENSPGDSLYLIQSGTIVVYKTIDKEEGIEKSLSILEEGDTIGEMSLLDGAPRTASVRATKDTVLLRIGRDEFNDLIIKYPHAGTKLLQSFIKIISRRLSQTNRELMVLYEIGRILSTVRDLKHISEAIIERLIFYLDVSFAAFALINDITGQVEFISAHGEGTAKVIGLIHSPNEGVPGLVFKSRETIRIDDFLADERVKNVKRFGYERRMMIVSPLLKDNKAIGFILVANKKDGSVFTGANVNLINGVASQATPAIEAARFHKDIKAKETYERKYVQF